MTSDNFNYPLYVVRGKRPFINFSCAVNKYENTKTRHTVKSFLSPETTQCHSAPDAPVTPDGAQELLVSRGQPQPPGCPPQLAAGPLLPLQAARTC